MKKLLLLFSFLLAYCVSFAQYPITQNLGAPKTLVVSKGGLAADSSFILPTFTDTFAANISPYIKVYPGNMIFLSGPNQVWVRNSDATKWLLLAVSGGTPGTVTSVTKGYGISNTAPNPITTAGTIAVDTTASTGLSAKYLRIVDTANRFVSNITRVAGKDSIIFYKGSGRFAIKDSIGVPPTRTISTTSPLTGGGALSSNLSLSINQADQTTNGYLSSADWNKFNNKIAIISVTSPLTTSSGPNQTVNLTIDSASPSKSGYISSIDFNKFSNKVDTIYRTPGKDSIQFKINGRYHAIKDSAGGGGGFFSQNIIMNGTSANRLGNYVNGDTIPVAGLGLDAAFAIITQKAVPPTYVAPTTTISSSPSQGNYEIGSSLSLVFSSTFTQNDAGSLTGTTYYKNNTTALASNTDIIASLTSTTQYKVTKTYNQGPCKLNNLGVLDCTGRINAGSVTSSNINFTPLPKRYWGYTSSGTPSSSQIITASGGGSELTTSKDKIGFSVVVTGTNQYVYYAYPTSFGTLTSIIVSGLESIGAFNLTTVSVTNAQGYAQNYYVYTSQNQFNNTTVTFTSVN